MSTNRIVRQFVMTLIITAAACIFSPPAAAQIPAARADRPPDANRPADPAASDPALSEMGDGPAAAPRPPQLLRAYELANAGKYDDSVKELKKYIKAGNEQCADCHEGLGRVYLLQAKYKDAAASFRRALESESSHAVQLHALLGVALYNQGGKKQLQEAVTVFQKAIQSSGGRMTQAYYNLGYALLKLERNEEGAAALATYLEKEPRAANAHQIRSLIKDPSLVDVPFATPFSVATTSGETTSLDGLRGKVVLLDFWASWCLPCRQEMPNVRKAWKKFADQGFVLLGVSLDSEAKQYQSFLEEEKMDWPQYFDNKGWANQLARLYGVRSIPRAVLIDRDGFIRATNLRGGELSRKIEELLKKQ